MLNNDDNSIANQMIRPRILYVTTEKSNDAFNSSSCRVNLPDAIVPEDGFTLVAGLRSFGFNACAWNISEEQKNNRFIYQLTYKEPEFLYNPNNTPQLTQNPNYSPTQTNYFTETVQVIIPDGLYQSLDELFTFLSRTDGECCFLKSGYERSFTEGAIDPSDITNFVSIPVLWKETSYGFSIELANSKSQIFSKYLIEGNEILSSQLASQIDSVFIGPDPDSPNFWNLLFTNNIQNMSPSTPSYLRNKNGTINPPQGITFQIFDIVESIQNTRPSWAPLGEYNYHIIENGNEQNIDSSSGKYQIPTLPFHSIPWKSFSTPRLSPLYLDVACQGLSTQNLTNYGLAGNIFHRQFLSGANQGLEGIFQEFAYPIWYRLENRDQITQLTFSFTSESNLWVFYNMNFYLEIVFFEVLEEKTDSYVPYVPPSNPDILTDFIQKYARNGANPRSFADPSGGEGVVYFSQEKKRRK